VQPPVVQPQHAVAAGGEGRVVRHQHQRRAQSRLQLEQQVAHQRAGVVVEVAGGLVGQQQARPVHQRARDRHALLLAARELAG
jgi:hypothetical protein